MKKLVRVLVALVVVLAVAVAVALYFVDSLAKRGIEKGATYALKAETTVDSLSLGLLRGTMTMDGLTVANPDGYETPHLLKSGRFDFQVDPGTVLGDTVRINRFHLDGLDMNIEQKGLTGSNVSQILANLKRFEGSGGAAADDSGGKKVAVDEIVIENVVAHVRLLPISGKASTLKVEVPKVVLNNVTSDNAKGVAISELTARLLPAILDAVLKKSGGVIPGDLLGSLRTDLAGAVESLGGGAAGLLGQSGGDLGKGLDEATRTKIDEAKEGLDKAKEDLGGGLRGLLGGEKKPSQ
jgi:hypothetical protein